MLDNLKKGRPKLWHRVKKRTSQEKKMEVLVVNVKMLLLTLIIDFYFALTEVNLRTKPFLLCQ